MATIAEKGSGQIVDVSQYLKGIEFPATKQDLLRCVQKNQAQSDVINQIQKLEDRQYTNMSEVMKGFSTLQQGKVQGQQTQGLQGQQPKGPAQSKQTPQQR